MMLPLSLPDWSLLSSTFLLVFVNEIGDKSQLVAFSLSSRGHHPAALFTGSAAALVLSSTLAALVGCTAGQLLPSLLPWAAGGLFLILGMTILLRRTTPRLEDLLTLAASAENKLARDLPPLFRREEALSPAIKEIIDQEKNHGDQFEMIFLGRKLERLIPPPPEEISRALEDASQKNLAAAENLTQALPGILAIEEAALAFYQYLARSLEGQPGRRPMKNHLAAVIEEEKEHLSVFQELCRQKTGSTGSTGSTGEEAIQAPPAGFPGSVRPRQEAPPSLIRAFFSALALVFLAEVGDRTQIISFSNAAHSGKLGTVILGSSLALISTSLIAVFAGHRLTSVLSPRVLRFLSGGLFLAAGTWILLRLAAG